MERYFLRVRVYECTWNLDLGGAGLSELEVDGKHPHSLIACGQLRILLEVREFAHTNFAVEKTKAWRTQDTCPRSHCCDQDPDLHKASLFLPRHSASWLKQANSIWGIICSSPLRMLKKKSKQDFCLVHRKLLDKINLTHPSLIKTKVISVALLRMCRIPPCSVSASQHPQSLYKIKSK